MVGGLCPSILAKNSHGWAPGFPISVPHVFYLACGFFLGLPRTNHEGPGNLLGRKGQTQGIVALSASGSGVMEMECTTGSRQRGFPFHAAVQISPSVALAQASVQLIWWFTTSGQDENGRQEEGQWQGSW